MVMAAVDLIIVVGYLATIVIVGLVAGRRERDVGDFLVGGRSVPWPAVLGSIIATEVSAATFLAVPGVGFAENYNYLQFGIGSILARIFIATVFLGAFFQINCFSIYEFLGKRYGSASHYTASVYFLVTRLLASGVRLMIAVTGVAVIMDVPFGACLLVFGILTVIYTATGGIKAVIWTDCVQGVVFISAGIAVLTYLVHRVGAAELFSVAAEGERLEVFRWVPDQSAGATAWFSDPQWIVIAVIFGFVSSAAAFGTDQDSTQRMLSCRDARRARWSLICSGFVAIPIAALFVTIGVALFAFYQLHPDPFLPEEADKAFPWFISTQLPAGLKGLLLAGVLAAAMSSLDSAMAALGSSALRDLWQPLAGHRGSEKSWLWRSRGLTVLFAVIILAIAWTLREGGQFLWLAFQVTALTYSGLLGIFLLGLLTGRGSDRTNPWAMLCGSLFVWVLLMFDRWGVGTIGWTWHLLLGTLITFLLGSLARDTNTQAPAAQ